MDDKLITIEEVTSRIGFTRHAVYKWIKQGKFPKQVKIGSRSRWVDKEVSQWVKERADNRQ